MKKGITLIIAIITLLLALVGGVSTIRSGGNSADRAQHKITPIWDASSIDEERRMKSRRERVRSPESEFLRHLSKIEPITEFDDPADGYFKGYLLAREAEKLLGENLQGDNRDAVLAVHERAYGYFLGVRERAPEWKGQMVSSRLEKTKQGLKEAYFAKVMR